MHYTKRYNVATPSDSDVTSAAYLVADWSKIGIQCTGAGDIVQGTLVGGTTAAVAEGDWSTLTTLGSAGAYTLEPGMYWIRVIRNASSTTVLLAGEARG